MSIFKHKKLFGLQDLIDSVKTSIQASILPSGAIMWFNLKSAPSGWVVCDGTNGTPNLIGRYPLGSTSSIGAFVECGLPNITGGNKAVENQGYFTGAFYQGGASGNSRCGDQDHAGPFLAFDASRSCAVYGKYRNNAEFVNKVIPDSVRLLPCMKL